MSIYAKQWENEIKMFFRGIRNNQAEIFGESLAVEYSGECAENDPRFICYDFGGSRLRDDHFCAQHSRELTKRELQKILSYLQVNGVNVGEWDIYYYAYSY